jgi:hypothetical protein
MAAPFIVPIRACAQQQRGAIPHNRFFRDLKDRPSVSDHSTQAPDVLVCVFWLLEGNGKSLLVTAFIPGSASMSELKLALNSRALNITGRRSRLVV